MLNRGAMFCAAILIAVSSAAGQTLKVGDKAPKLDIGQWVKGDPVTSFEKDRVYVVEFWSTWCGPCIRGMPHVSELQKKYKDEGVRIIGVNIWEDPANVEPFMEDRGNKPSGDELMDYTVAIETKGDDIKNGIMSETWMKAAGRNGIPSAFIVDGSGRIAWMGHPGNMDDPLAKIVASTKKAAGNANAGAEGDNSRPFALMVGDKAPKLDIGEWVKGKPITGFEKGRTYVVEFWATWCGPCISGMPHVSELQKKYKDDGVRVIGVNIWDDPANVEPFMEDRGDKPSGDELMKYTVAIEKKGDNIRNGIMSETWMKAAGKNGIPSAFIVDGTGRIAWIGHPMSMDKPLAKVVAGEWDYEAAAAQQRKEMEAQAKLMAAREKIEEFQVLFQGGEYDDAYKLADELVDDVLWDNSGYLNMIAWVIVDPDNMPEKQDLKLALKAAKRASELTDDEDPMVLDTVAKVYFDMGKLDRAIKIQKKAVELAKGSQAEEELKDRLKEYLKKAKSQG